MKLPNLIEAMLRSMILGSAMDVANMVVKDIAMLSGIAEKVSFDLPSSSKINNSPTVITIEHSLLGIEEQSILFKKIADGIAKSLKEVHEAKEVPEDFNPESQISVTENRTQMSINTNMGREA